MINSHICDFHVSTQQMRENLALTLYRTYDALSASLSLMEKIRYPRPAPITPKTALCAVPMSHTRQSTTVHAGIASSVNSREPLGAHIGMVTRPSAWSPTTSGKS